MDELLEEIKKEFSDFKLVPKANSKLMKFIGTFLAIITFGQATEFMTRFHTTVGYTVYVSQAWEGMSDVSKQVLLRHERVHMRQRKKFGFLLYAFLYVLFPFPLLFAYFRMRFEREAYTESMHATADLYPGGLGILERADYRKKMLKHFTSAEYFWMWPFRKGLERWFDATLAELREKKK
jgi:hypothetical protein